LRAFGFFQPAIVVVQSRMAANDPSTSPLENRLIELEIKLGFMEDLVEHLNQQVAAQQQALDLLVQEVLRLREQGAEQQPVFRSLRDELPPHY
jgi:SlyX protein